MLGTGRTRKIRKATYYDNSHIAVLFEMYGSVWPKVLPYCLLNVLVTFGIYYLKRIGLDLTFSSSGHSFMSIMISFLVVSRSQIVYGRFMEARGYLTSCYRSTREIIQVMYALTSDRDDAAAIKWREDVAYRTIVLLRVSMRALESTSTRQDCWIGESQQIIDELQNNKFEGIVEIDMDEANLGVPYMLIFFLRKTILENRTTFSNNNNNNDTPLHINEELSILGFVTQFASAWSGLAKLVSTPFPFPLVQMARSFLFFWIYSLPFALAGTGEDPTQTMMLMFFLTYGFAGIEHVSMELDDPFGTDPNDFDDEYLSQLAIDDILMVIHKADGPESEKRVIALAGL